MRAYCLVPTPNTVLSRGITKNFDRVLLQESEKLEQMRFCVGLMGLAIACINGLQWARITFALAVLLQGVEQAAVLIVLDAARQGMVSGPYKNKMTIQIFMSSSIASLVFAVAGLIALACGF